MIAECHEVLADAALISLDHDLNKKTPESLDPGGCHFYPRSGFLNSVVMGLCTYAPEADRKLISTSLVEAAAQRSYSFVTGFIPLPVKHMNVPLDLNYSHVHCRQRS